MAIKVEEFLPHAQEYMTMKILAIDLGKYKSVACNYVTATGMSRFATVVTHANEFDRLLSQESPDLVVIETCSIAGWVHDLCCQRGVKCQVANPSSKAWKQAIVALARKLLVCCWAMLRDSTEWREPPPATATA